MLLLMVCDGKCHVSHLPCCIAHGVCAVCQVHGAHHPCQLPSPWCISCAPDNVLYSQRVDTVQHCFPFFILSYFCFLPPLRAENLKSNCQTLVTKIHCLPLSTVIWIVPDHDGTFSNCITEECYLLLQN